MKVITDKERPIAKEPSDALADSLGPSATIKTHFINA